MQFPTGKRWVNADQMWVFLHDEAPQIGSGWRSIIYKEGRKWAYIASARGIRRLRMSEWLTIKAGSVKRSDKI